ncbi:hypothetical protein, partial [Mesorhizobium sp. M2D.F.Ca.ET.206.01.1.1]|uniref:hypothetical protein n=1 Tax=Mesorhizobium sp. M2D.F.Ca.ET.206.01.1.1 TaxID=2563939 RepID=UPI001AEE4002
PISRTQARAIGATDPRRASTTSTTKSGGLGSRLLFFLDEPKALASSADLRSRQKTFRVQE